MKLFFTQTLIITLFFIFYCSLTYGQKVSGSLCEKFLASEEIYVIESSLSSMDWHMVNGETKTVSEMAEASWPNKKITPITLEEFNSLEEVKSKFHLFIGSLNSEIGDTYSTIDFMAIQKGKTGRSPSNVVYYLYVDVKDLLDSGIGERVQNGIHSMQTIVDNYDDKSERSSKLYKAADYKSHLERKTLYVRSENVNEDFKDKAKLEKAYPHKIKLISNEEWVDVVTNKRKDALYIEYIDGTYEALDIYDAETGTLIISTYPWFKLHADYKLDKKFFKAIR